MRCNQQLEARGHSRGILSHLLRICRWLGMPLVIFFCYFSPVISIMDKGSKAYNARLKNLEKARAKKKAIAGGAKTAKTKTVRKPRVKKSPEELKKIRSEAGKKGAAARWRAYRERMNENSKEINYIVRALQDAPKLKEPEMTTDKYIEPEKEEYIDLTGSHERRKKIKEGEILNFMEDTNSFSESMIECLKKIQAGNKDVKKCINIAGAGFSHLAAAYDMFERGMLELKGQKKEVKELLIEGVNDLALNLASFSSLITNKILM